MWVVHVLPYPPLSDSEEDGAAKPKMRHVSRPYSFPGLLLGCLSHDWPGAAEEDEASCHDIQEAVGRVTKAAVERERHNARGFIWESVHLCRRAS